MNNKILNEEASHGNFQRIEKIFEKFNFTQKEIDEAFRECIRGSKKIQKESYKNCINLFIKKTEQINYRNSKFNNTTILMYSIDESNDTATDLIISCSRDDLDMNLTDFSGENTLFHLVNNKDFSIKTKSDFIKDLTLSNYNIYSKNNKNETLFDILQNKECMELLEEIKNKIEENKFDQNKLTLMYNKKNYEDLYTLIEKYEKDDKQRIRISSNSIKYNKLKLVINSLNIKSKNLKFQPIPFLLENKEILYQIMDILKQVVFDEGGGNNNNKFSLCLILNKMIMYYQIDYYNGFISLNNTIKNMDNFFFNNNILFNLYKYFINIDMMIQRGYYTNANYELNILKNKINSEPNLIVNLKNYISNKNKSYIILPNDINFDLKNIKTLLNLYQIFINSFFCEKNNNKYTSLIKELKNIKIEDKEKEKSKEKEKDNNCLVNNNNNMRSFQKYLLLRLNYWNCVTKNPNGKISYKINDNLCILNIEGNRADNEFNKIYYYHYQGIISLKNGNYNISSYFFLKCLQIILQNTSTQLVKRNHFYPTILFNLALSYFYSKKYKNTIKYLYFLLNYSNNKSKFFINYKYIYYRLGLSNLELLLSENKNINLLYNSYINNKFILKTYQKSSFNEKIDIIEYFKKTFILIKNNPNDPIYFSTLINLVFCYIIKGNYIEAIFYLKLNKSKDIMHKNIIRSYLIQCYIYLNKINLAEKISEEFLKDEKYFKDNNNPDLKFFERLNSRLVTVKGFKLNYLLNMLKISAANKNFKEMHKNLVYILDSFNINISLDDQGKMDTNEEMPSYIINVFVYYYLLINRKDLALDVLKKRRVKEIIISTNRS